MFVERKATETKRFGAIHRNAASGTHEGAVVQRSQTSVHSGYHALMIDHECKLTT